MPSNKNPSSSRAKTLLLCLFAGILFVGVLLLFRSRNESLKIVPNSTKSQESYKVIGGNRQIKHTYFGTKTDSENRPGFVIDDATTQVSMHYQPQDKSYTRSINPQLTNESNAIIFPSILPAIDLKYTPLESGIKEEIILQDQNALDSLVTNHSFTFDLELSGVTYETDTAGNIIPVFTDTTTGATYAIPPAFMRDASGSESTNVTQIFTQQESDDSIKLQIRVVPDIEWIQDASRQFPIVIDPTVIKGAAPISYWPINEGAGSSVNDTSTNANALTITNATWKVDAARSDNLVGKIAMRFDGSGDYLTRAYDSDYNFGTGSFSISLWARIPNSAAGPDIILARYADAGFKIYMDANEFICFSIDDDSTWEPEDPACSATAYNDSTWHHFEAVKNTTSSIILYIDGKMIKTNAATTADSSLSGTSPPLYIGIDSDGSSNSFQGDIDSVSIFNYARDANQIKADAFLHPQTAGSIGSTVVDTNSNGLVGHWKMDEASWNGTAGEVLDTSGNGNNGVRVGDAATSAGKYGNGGTFDGTGDYINIGDKSTLEGMPQLTISGWVYLDSLPTENYVPFGKDSGSGGYRIVIASDGGVSIALATTNNAWYTSGTVAASSSNITTGNWHHITGTYDGSWVKIYLDGKELGRGSQSISGNIISDSNEIRFGFETSYNIDYLDGKLDEIRFYNRALSPAEVQALYNWSPGPVAYWDFNEGGGQSASDRSGNGNTMTLGSTAGTDVNDPSWTTGKFGNALNFDLYDDDYATVTSSSAPTGQNPWTLSLWAEIEDSTIGGRGYRSSLVHWGDSTVPINDYSYSNLTYVYTPPTTTIDWTTSPSSIVNLTSYSVENRWNYLTVTYDGTSVRTYFNGIFQTSANHTMAIEGSDIIFGGYPLSMKSYGKIDEVKIYNYARTTQQIVEDMNAGHPAPGSPVGSALVHYNMDEGNGETLHNSGNGGSGYDADFAGSCPGDSTCPTWTNDGRFGKAVRFDGTNDYASSTVTSWLDQGAGSWAISAWVKRTGDISGADIIIGKTGYHSGIALGGTDNVNCTLINTSDTYHSVNSGTLALNEWNHMLCQYNVDTNLVEYFINGNKVGEIAFTGTIRDFSDTVYFGGNSVPQAPLVDLDEVKLYTSALNTDQVKAEYNQGKATVLGALSTNASAVTSNSSDRSYCPPGDSTATCSPVAEWKMDENTGTSTINDSSGNGNYGSMAGSITESDWIKGKYGSALNFGGTDEYVSLSNYSALNISAPGSFSAWVKTSLDSCKPVYSLSHSTSNYTWIVYTGDGCTGTLTNELITVGRFNSTTTYILGYTTATRSELLDGNWHHIYVTMGSGTVKIYLDGIQRTVSVGSGSNNGTFGGLSQVNNAEIASRLYNNNGRIYLNGAVDNLAIFNYARTPAQIAWDYNRGKPVAQWKLNECTGATVHSTNETYNSTLNGTWTGTGGGTQTSVGDCSTGGTAWGNGASGRYNGSLNFDGSDDRVTVNSNANINLFNEMSFGGWIKTSFAESVAQTILSKGNFALSGTSSKFALVLDTSGSAGAFYKNISSSIGDTKNLRDGNWHHVLSTISSSANSWKLFVDGKQVVSTTLTAAASADTTGNLDIGTLVYDSAPGSFMSGQIDDVQIFNYALTNQQVRTVFNSGAVRYE